jgi:hypothetical protein
MGRINPVYRILQIRSRCRDQDAPRFSDAQLPPMVNLEGPTYKTEATSDRTEMSGRPIKIPKQ